MSTLKGSAPCAMICHCVDDSFVMSDAFYPLDFSSTTRFFTFSAGGLGLTRGQIDERSQPFRNGLELSIPN